MEVSHKQYFEQMPCYVSVQDREYRIIDGNLLFRADFGDCIGHRCYEVYKQRTEVCPGCPVALTFADGLSHGSEQLLTTKDGRQKKVMVHTTPLSNGSGEIEAVLEMHTDITEVKRLQTLLSQSQERLAQLFEEVPCYLTVQGPDLVIQHANRKFRETFGEAVGDHCYRVYKHREEPCLVCPARQAFEEGQVQDHEEVVVSTEGEKINVVCTTTPIRDKDGRVTAVMEMSTDITQIRRLQSQLTSIGLLVGSISHGIKGLLTGLDGGMYLVNSGFDKNKPERVEKGWAMVQRNVERIRSMVLDILYYAKDRELLIEDVDVAQLGSELRELMEKKSADLDVKLQIHIAEDAGTFDGDTRAVRATLINLLENSLEACRADHQKSDHHTKLTARRADPYMVFDIEDNGIGMDRETQNKVFSLFFSSKGIKGTGLGLFISHKIVDKHGGTITVRSEVGRGSRFLVRFPLKARPSTQLSEARCDPAAGGTDHGPT